MPQHRTYVGAFRIGKYPVTNQEFDRFIDAGGYHRSALWSQDGWKWLQGMRRDERGLPESQGPRHDRGPNHPVVQVTWYEANAYCHWLTEHLGSQKKIGSDQVVRLPTEAEWEKAARGTDGQWWPWGDEWDAERANTAESGRRITPVGVYPEGVSPYGVVDMAGNVGEWTASLFKPYPYDRDDGREDPGAGGLRSLRGGSWDDTAARARAACRPASRPAERLTILGFRWVVTPGGHPPSARILERRASRRQR